MMASFFRKRIGHKVLSMLLKRHELKSLSSPNVISSLVKVNRIKGFQPELHLPWKYVEQLCDQPVNPEEFVRLLRNQGLPTAEGFIDIKTSEFPIPSLVFTVDKHIFSKIVLLDIFDNEEDLAGSSCLFEDIKKKNIVVHCSVPSIGEICHMTHFRSLIYSNFVANINKFAGHEVTKIAHVNDWSPAAAAFLTGFKQFKMEGITKKKDSNNLLEIYKAASIGYNNDMKFKLTSDICYDKMKQGDRKITSEWQNLKQMCLSYYDSIYKRIGVHFDELHFDSTCFQKSERIASQLSNIIFDKDGSRIHFEDLGDKSFINITQEIDSSVLYNLSRHVSAATEIKERYNFDMMYYINPSSQADFLSTVFYFMKKLNYTWAEDLHQVILKQSFDSKRKDKLRIESILDQAKDKMITKLHEHLQMELNDSLEELAEQLSVSSFIVNCTKRRKNVDYEFDWKDVINFERYTAASFQFCSAGLKGLQEDSEFIFKTDIDTSTLLEPEAHHLILHLARFDEMVFKSYMILEPCIILQYLSSLWYFTDRVTKVLKLDIKKDRLRVIKSRLMLLSATLKVLNKGLYLLGITPLKKVYSIEKDFVQNT